MDYQIETVWMSTLILLGIIYSGLWVLFLNNLYIGLTIIPRSKRFAYGNRAWKYGKYILWMSIAFYFGYKINFYYGGVVL